MRSPNGCSLQGQDDSLASDIPRSEKVLRAAGALVIRRTYPGGHQFPPKPLMREGLLWLNEIVKE